MKNPIATLQTLWRVLRPLPGGTAILSRVFGFVVPYSGTIRPEIVELEPGLVRLRMRDRRAVRNHLQSIHAIAMANLAEATSGLSVSLCLNGQQRAILTEFNIRYLKKARGTLLGVARFQLPDGFVEGDVSVEVDLLDRAEDTVASARATWRVGPVRR